MVKDFDFDAALKGFIELVEINLKKSADATEVSAGNEMSSKPLANL